MSPCRRVRDPNGVVTLDERLLRARLQDRVIDIDGRQVLHIQLRNLEPDAVFDVRHRADWDGHFLLTPEVPLLQEYVSDLVGLAVDDQPLDPSDISVGRTDVLSSPHGHLP